MFSSLNKLRICELDPSDSDEYEKIMLFRDPYIRTISCFLNWMVREPKRNGIMKMTSEQVIISNKDWLILLLLKEPDFDFHHYKVLLEANNIIELFKIYILTLPKIKTKNEHMHSQVKIVCDNKFIICHKDYYSQYIDLLGELKGNNAQAFESRCWLGEVFKKQD